VYHSPPSSSKVKSKWSYTPNLPVSVHCVDRENFAVLYGPHKYFMLAKCRVFFVLNLAVYILTTKP
jgi:hypothetical protein